MSKVSEASSALFLLEGLSDFQSHALSLASQTRRNIAILSRELDSPIYGSQEFVDAVSQLARGNRNSHIQILVKNTKTLVENGHKLAKLSQRLSSKISLRKLTVEPDDKDMGFMLCDSAAVLYKNDDTIFKGFANTDAAVEVKRLREVFDYVWQHGELEPELQLLNI
ncbi:MAG: hypothetical protein EOO68_14710 [Moraxellaceae bacterium]|nr:MAG: hypothetical protein EOO68_14710 [Moraxellaceae bacterium]